jgi:hypothetical protein
VARETRVVADQMSLDVGPVGAGAVYPPGSVWTTRYGNGRLLGAPGTNLVAVRITLYPPRFRLPYAVRFSIPELAPTRALFKLRGQEFDGAFTEYLDAHGADFYRARFAEIRETLAADGKPDAALALCCYEDLSTGAQCHRTTFAEWFEQQTAETVGELPAADERTR